MRDLVIGDMHFGIKTNNVTWLEQQINFIKTQLFNTIDTENVDRIIFLGDLFDIRYSVNQQVGIEVKKLIRELANKFNKKIIFIAGNHDYYSPLEEFTEYNAYNLLFGDEFIKCYPNIIFVNSEPALIDDALFLPWYYTENPNHFDDILYNYDFGREIKAVYCHADLTVWPGGRISSLKGCPVYSGHIHYIIEDELANLHNIGAALPLTFSDVNQERYLYIIEDYKITKKIANVTTPSFKRIYNEKIFEITEKDITNSYVQLCIANSNINKSRYIDQIKYLKTTYINANIRIHLIESEVGEESIVADGFNTNINQYIESNIPEHLNNKYEYIKGKLEHDN